MEELFGGKILKNLCWRCTPPNIPEGRKTGDCVPKRQWVKWLVGGGGRCELGPVDPLAGRRGDPLEWHGAGRSAATRSTGGDDPDAEGWRGPNFNPEPYAEPMCDVSCWRTFRFGAVPAVGFFFLGPG